MKRTLISLLVCLSLIFTLCMPAGAAGLSDIAGHTHEAAIRKAVDLGIIHGYDDGTFRPDNGVTRAEFCAMTNRALGIAGCSPLTFQDVPLAAWYFADVRSAVTVGYIVGMPDDRFEPDGPITRYQCALIFARLAGAAGSGTKLAYTDAAQVPGWARAGVVFAQESGIFSSFVDDTFHGNQPLTRAETAAALTALLDWFDKLPVFCTLVTADEENQPLDTETLYKNEYAHLSFLVSGRSLADGIDLDDLPAHLAFAITGAIGIRTLDEDGEVMEPPAYTACTRLDDNTLRIDVTLDRADYLPAWLAISVRLPADGSLAAEYALQTTSFFVKYTAVGEYLPAAESPLVLHRAQSLDNRVVHRYLSWTRHPSAEYHVAFCVFDAGGEVISRRTYNGRYAENDERVEIDLTDFIIAHPEAAYGAGAYQAVVITAESDSRSWRFYPRTLPLNATQYAQLRLDGHDEARAAVVGDKGVELTLDALHLDALASGAYTCALRLSVLDADQRDVTDRFTLTGDWTLGTEQDLTAAAQKETVELGRLTASAPAGVYTLLLQFTVGSPSSAQTLYLSGALVVE